MKVEVFESLEKISEKDWREIIPESFPFASHAFLLALEQGDCLGRRTGWKPVFLTAWENQELLGAFLLFSKTNSYGEYIFDFNWAQAFESYGFRYYPKLLAAIPFTPATGPKILLHKKLNVQMREKVSNPLLEKAKAITLETKSSSLHALFITEEETKVFAQANFSIRHSFQYHWQNENFKSFEEFLGKFRAKRRKEIVRERSQAKNSPVKIERLTGDALNSSHAKSAYQYYESTVLKMGGYAYLTPEFFELVFATMKDQILFVQATRDGIPVAGALNYFSGKTLFGRHWGCLEEYKSLHFELCYYQGIEFAIERNLDLFEAGAQGEHKFQRGFMPRLTYSAHIIENPQLGPAIGDFIEEEKKQITEMFSAYAQQTPFSRENI